MKQALLTLLIAISALAAMAGTGSTTNRAWTIPVGTYQYLEYHGDRTNPFLLHISYRGDLVEITVNTLEYKTVNRCRTDGERVFWSASRDDGSMVSAHSK